MGFRFSFLIGAVLWSVAALGQTWREDYQRSQTAYNEENYTEALSLANSSLKGYLAQDGQANANYAAILRLLSSIHFVQQQFEEGLTVANKEISIREEKRDSSYATALVNRAQFLEQLGKYNEAVPGLLEAQKIFLTVYPPGHPQVLDCDLQLCIHYYFAGDLGNAQKFLQPVLDDAQKNPRSETNLDGMYYAGLMALDQGKNKDALRWFETARKGYEDSKNESFNYVMVLYQCANALGLDHRYAEAEKIFASAQAGYEELAGKTGEDYFGILRDRGINLSRMGKQDASEALLQQLKPLPGATLEAISLLNFTAGVYQLKGEYVKAASFYQEALALPHKNEPRSQLVVAETLQNRAGLWVEENQFDAALKDLSEAKRMMEKSGSSRYLSVLNRLGDVHVKMNRLAEAHTNYKESLTLARTMNPLPRNEETSAIIGMASIDLKKGRFFTADSTYELVIKKYESNVLPDGNYILAINSLASSKQSQGQLALSRILMRRAVDGTGKMSGKTSISYGIALENLALVNMRLGELVSAKAEIDSSLQILEMAGGKESLPYANSVMSLGRYYQITGDYTRAEPYLKNARDVIKLKRGDQSDDYAFALNALALLYQTLGNYQDAEPLLLASRTIIIKNVGKLNEEYATSVQNLATLYQLEGRFGEAEPLLKEALETDRQVLGENHPRYATTLQNLATLYEKLGKYAEAQQMLERAIESIGKNLGKEHPSYATTISNLAALYQDKGQFDKAEATWKQSVALRKKILGEDHPDYARSLYGLAGVYHGLGQLDLAKQYYEPVVAKYQKQVKEFFPSLSEKEKGAFYAQIKPVFDSYQDFCVQYLIAKPDQRGITVGKLYDLQLATKAILLNASNKVRARIQQSGSPALQNLFREWLSLKESIVRAYNYSQTERDRFKIDIKALESRANDLEKQLSVQSDVFRLEFEKDVTDWKAVQTALKESEAAVEIIRMRKRYVKDSIYYVALIVKKSESFPSLVIWKQGNHLEGRLFKYHRNTIKYQLKDTISYLIFWAPLTQALSRTSTVYLSCDGVFNKVNFNSIYNPSSKHFLIEDFTIRQVSNTIELTETRGSKTAGQSARLFGYPDFNLGGKNQSSASTKRNPGKSYNFEGESIPMLPATEVEVDKIQELLNARKWEVKSYKKMEATEGRIKEMDSPRLIHIATHGFFLNDIDIEDEEDPVLSENPLFRSGVLLAGAGVERSLLQNDEDGVLTAYEAMNLNLDKTELVVLSACETGLGEVRNGEGVYGLQRAFLVAGAGTVMMSLWQVDDIATQDLMNAFYTNWISGTSQHLAFRNAQMQMKQKYKEPYFWGAFVLIGF